jgi:hypothetical protein
MLLTLLFLCGSALLGLGIVRRCLRQHLNNAEKVLWGIVFGWSISTVAVYLIARWQLRLSSGCVIGVTVFALAIGFALLAPTIRRTRFSWQPHLTGVIWPLLFFTPVYLTFFSTHFFAQDANGVYSGGSAYADLSFHAALSSSFAYGTNFPPVYLPSAGKPLLYPFLPDFQIAALMTTGISMRTALLITSLILAMATTALLYYFALRITAKPLVGAVTTILFLLNGGLGFIDLISDWHHSGKGLAEFWSTLTVNYANYSDHALHWPNIITDGFVPQRPILFGLPLGVMVLTLFAAEWARRDSSEKSWQGGGVYLFSGFITGLLPLFHMHTFIALGLISVVLFLVKPHRRWLLFWLVSLTVASPSVVNLLSHTNGGEFLRLQPGWMGHASSFFPWYLLRNLGIPLLLAIPAWFLIERHWRKFYFAFVFVLAFALTVVVSPNLFDNGKLIYYWHAMNSVIVANLLVHITLKYRQRLLASILMLACVATGITALQSERLQHTLLFSNEEIAAATFAKNQTGPRSLFLTAPVTNQPVLCLAGRTILRGPTSWLWSHGYEFRDREADVRRIYAGTPDTKELLNYYDVDYIYLGNDERQQLHAQDSFFNANFPVVYRSQNISIYDVRNVDQGQPSASSFVKRLEYDPFALFVDFPNTSFFAYRSLVATNGRLPAMVEFNEAMRLLTRDASIHSPGWKEQVEANKQRLIDVQAARLSGLSNAEFVNSLTNNSAASNLTTQFTRRLEEGSETRSSVLRKVVDDAQFYEREYNRAFVLMHYFGYLKRNPVEPPDSGLTGFNYWCNIVGSSKDYRSISRAFLESDEYRKSVP